MNKKTTTKSKRIGIYGLGPMGQSLARNWAQKGYEVFISNRTIRKAGRFLEDLKKNEVKEVKNIKISKNLEKLVQDVNEGPIILMISSGDPQEDLINNNTINPIDEVLFTGSVSVLSDGKSEKIKPLIDIVTKNHVIIDAGNSHPYGSAIRDLRLSKKGINFIGMGVSGGELGALEGPAIMPSGAKITYKKIEKVLKDVAAKTDGTVCCDLIGPGGAGHFVKTIHNGIEYSIMAGIAEIYWLLKEGLKFSNSEIRDFYVQVNKNEFKSYLLDITVQILSEDNGNVNVLDKILDIAGAKGTGKWTVQVASDLGVPVGALYSALELRKISNRKNLRLRLSENDELVKSADDSKKDIQKSSKVILQSVSDALRGLILVSYIQGFEIIRQASKDLIYTRPHKNSLSNEDKITNYSKDELSNRIQLSMVARVWKAGCIIRSNLLGLFEQLFEKESNHNLLEDKKIQDFLKSYFSSWKKTIKVGLNLNISLQTTTSAFNYLIESFSKELPTNMIQAQRDLFGAHTFQRIDEEGVFHHYWGKEYSVTKDYKK